MRDSNNITFERTKIKWNEDGNVIFYIEGDSKNITLKNSIVKYNQMKKLVNDKTKLEVIESDIEL
jgi:hypothetical protein